MWEGTFAWKRGSGGVQTNASGPASRDDPGLRVGAGRYRAEGTKSVRLHVRKWLKKLLENKSRWRLEGGGVGIPDLCVSLPHLPVFQVGSSHTCDEVRRRTQRKKVGWRKLFIRVEIGGGGSGPEEGNGGRGKEDWRLQEEIQLRWRGGDSEKIDLGLHRVVDNGRERRFHRKMI